MGGGGIVNFITEEDRDLEIVLSHRLNKAVAFMPHDRPGETKTDTILFLPLPCDIHQPR